MNESKWIIQDWTGRKVFNIDFETFDCAEEHLCEYFDYYNLDYDEERQEYYIVEVA